MTATKAGAPSQVRIPETENAALRIGGHEVQLTNLDKVFWPELGYTKRDLLQYYADVSSALLPHLKDRAMIMKRYPNGIHGPVIFYPAKIVALADAFSSLISTRPFRKAYTVPEAIKIIQDEQGKYDRGLVQLISAVFLRRDGQKEAA